MVINFHSFLLKIKNIKSWAQNLFYLIFVLPDTPFKWYIMPNLWLEIILWKSENAKMTQNGLYSLNRNFWLQPYRSFQKSSRNLRGINYQMVHICWAPSRLWQSLRLQFFKQFAIILRRYRRPCMFCCWIDAWYHQKIFRDTSLIITRHLSAL